MRLLRLLILCLVLTVAPVAFAFSVNMSTGGDLVRWPDPHVTFYIQYAGSDDLSAEDSVAAVYAGFQAWVDTGCTTVTYEDIGDAPNPQTSLLVGGGPNGMNEIHWVEDDSWTLGSGVLGVTAPLSNSNGEIFEADIAFNGYHLNFIVQGGGGTDLQSVATHEIGHMFGIQHNLGPYSWNQPPTMAPSIAPKKKSRTLEDDDAMAICFLYPNAPPWTCDSDDECPRIVERDAKGDEYYAGEFLCADGGCTDPVMFSVGVANLGEACANDAACAGEFYCQPWQESGVCAQYCVSAEPDCPEGFSCAAFQSYPQYGACLPDSGEIMPPGLGPLGCVSSSSCPDPLVCLPTPTGEKKECVLLCQVDNPTSCPDGKICWTYGNTTGGCFWADQIPDATEPGPEPGPEPVPEVAPEPIEADAGGEGSEEEVIDDTTTPGPEPGPRGAGQDNGCSVAPRSLGLWAGLWMLWAVTRRRRVS